MAIVDISASVTSVCAGTAKTVLIRNMAAGVNANAGSSAKVVRITKGNAVVSVIATLNPSRVIRITKSGSAVASVSSIASKASAIRKLSKTVASVTTVIAKTTNIRPVSVSPSAAVTSVPVSAKKYRLISAQITCTGTMEAYRTDRDIQRDVSDYVPKYYEAFAVVVEMLRKLANESTRFNAKANVSANEFYPETASAAGIARWEAICDLEANANKPLSVRRQAVIDKLRDPGTITKARFNEVLNAFYTCEVEERPADYTVVSTILGKRGVPDNLADMEREVARVLPAHLAHEWVYTYLPWGEVDAAGLTWDNADEFTWDGLETAFLV